MKRTRDNCHRILVPIEIGHEEVLAEVFFHYVPAYRGSDFDEPSYNELWDIWEVNIVRYPGEGISEYLGSAPRFVTDALDRDFRNGGLTRDLAIERVEYDHDVAIGAREAAEEGEWL